MNLLRAEMKAKQLVKELEPYCDRAEVVGNVRRKKQSIEKIDLLLAPKSVMLFDLMAKITQLGSEGGARVASKQTVVVRDEFEAIKADLWFATVSNWPVMLLIKTGGTKSNQRIAKLCEQKKWHLSVNEGAIFDDRGKRITIEKEEDIFTLLEIPFVEPSWRQ